MSRTHLVGAVCDICGTKVAKVWAADCTVTPGGTYFPHGNHNGWVPLTPMEREVFVLAGATEAPFDPLCEAEVDAWATYLRLTDDDLVALAAKK